jgi:hypothetical protein
MRRIEENSKGRRPEIEVSLKINAKPREAYPDAVGFWADEGPAVATPLAGWNPPRISLLARTLGILIFLKLL